MKTKPVTLEGRYVRLEPLLESHVEAVAAVGLDPDLWRYFPYAMRTPHDLAVFLRRACDDRASGAALPFSTFECSSGRLVGGTRFMNLDRRNRRVEIGATWIARPWQRTAVNTEAKYLMLRHAFETWGCIRVELKVDARNERSRNAIRRIGATEEGTLRQHVVMPDGYLRDSVYYSILDREWPGVKADLESKLTSTE